MWEYGSEWMGVSGWECGRECGSVEVSGWE